MKNLGAFLFTFDYSAWLLTQESLILRNEYSEEKEFSLFLPHSLLESPVFSYRGKIPSFGHMRLILLP